jgi:hypothetical protein
MQLSCFQLHLFEILLQKKDTLVTAVQVQRVLLSREAAAGVRPEAQHHLHRFPEHRPYRVLLLYPHHPCMHDLVTCCTMHWAMHHSDAPK